MPPSTSASPLPHDFLLRRLHSLAGLVPVGAFVVVHLITNSMLMYVDAEHDPFQEKVDLIHSLGPLLIPVEIAFIFLPLLFHAVLGLKIWLEGKSNTASYRYGGNFRYMLQRVTGGIAFVFIMVHLWQMHWLGAPLGGGEFDPNAASTTTAQTLQNSSFWIIALYNIGIVSVAYHLANGIWTSLITWGITVGTNAQKRAGIVCAFFGIGLACLGLGAMNAAREMPVPENVEDTSVEQPPASDDEPVHGG